MTDLNVTAELEVDDSGTSFVLPGGDCIIWVNASDGPFGRRSVCKLIVHEVGHLRGLRHSPNPRSVMYPSPNRIPAGCRRLRRSAEGTVRTT